MGCTERHLFLACGEASGDRYGADLVSALFALNPGLRVTALGGPGLRNAGAEVIHDAADLGVMGFTDVARALPAILAARRRIGSFLAAEKPDLVVPLDFPGFNGWVAGKAKALGIPVFWLIAPQLWAWGGWRTAGFRRRIDRLGTILPFETAYFQERGFSVFPMGHPLSEAYGAGFPFEEGVARREAVFADRKAPLTVGLLPGSRRQELARLLPVLQVATKALTGHLRERSVRFVASVAPGLEEKVLAAGLGEGVETTHDPLPDLMPRLDMALVCSGTASLEAALAGVPHEIIYRTGRLDYFLARRLVRVPFIGLANLILDRPLVREHVQAQATPLPLVRSCLRWMGSAERRQAFIAGCKELRALCGDGGVWSRTARTLLAFCEDEAPDGGMPA